MAALSLGSSQEGVYSEKDLRLLHRVAELVALAVENALMYGALQLERRRLQMLLEVNNTLVTNLDIQQLFPATAGLIRKVVRQDYTRVAIHDEATQSLHMYALDSWPAEGLIGADTTISVQEPAAGRAFLEKEAMILQSRRVKGNSFQFCGPDAGTTDPFIVLHPAGHSKRRTPDPKPGQH